MVAHLVEALLGCIQDPGAVSAGGAIVAVLKCIRRSKMPLLIYLVEALLRSIQAPGAVGPGGGILAVLRVPQQRQHRLCANTRLTISTDHLESLISVLS